MKIYASKSTITRTLILFFALINEILQHLGIHPIPIGEHEVTQVVTLVATLGASLWAWWENNAFTKEAIEAQQHLKELKAQKVLERTDLH